MAFSSETTFGLAPAIDTVGTLAPAPAVVLVPKGAQLAIPDTLKLLLRPKNVVQPRASCKGRVRRASPTHANRKLLGA